MFKSLYNHYETTKHKWWVFYYISKFCLKLFKRAILHDFSKYNYKQSKLFSENVHKLKKMTYASEEYKETLERLKPALDHHYKLNPHHPEHYEKGFEDMLGVDRIEMIIDWLAATKRHEDGDINKSIDANQLRFRYSYYDKEWLRKIVGDLK